MTPTNAQQLTGEAAIPSTTSLDLPSGLAKILAMDTFNPASPMTQPAGLMTSVSPAAMAQTAANPMVPQYAQGGMVGPGGMPVAPTGMPPGQLDPGAVVQEVSQRPNVQQWQSTPMDPTQMHGAIDQQIAQNPDAATQIRAVIIASLQSGELTPKELQMGIQLIEAAVNNPAIYPQLRQFAIQQGLGGEDDFPPQYDRGFVMTMLTVAKSAQQLVQGGASMQGMGGGASPANRPISMATGGPVPGSANSPVPIMAHEGEYVVPKHVVGMKGREFFDKLVEKYNPSAM